MIDLDPETAASSDYFFMGVFDGVQSVLARHGLDLLVLAVPDHQDRYAYLERFVARGVVDGIILASTQRVDPRIDLLQSVGMPFVTLGRSTSGHGLLLDRPRLRGRRRTRRSTGFVSQGHRRIAVTLPYGRVNFGAVFEQAYRAALARHGLAFDPTAGVRDARNEQAGYRLVDRHAGARRAADRDPPHLRGRRDRHLPPAVRNSASRPGGIWR